MIEEEVRIDKYNNGNGNGNEVDDERVLEWEDGLPGLDDLTPLSQALIPAELLSAFRIEAEPPRSLVEVNRASRSTVASIRGQFGEEGFREQNPIVVDNDEAPMDLRLQCKDSRDFRKVRRIEESDSKIDRITNFNYDHNSYINNNEEDIGGGKTSKRQRLVWTPQLHKRFVDVVGHLGIKNAVPKTIMHLMNVEGLTRENVASHLQKYRLYLKRMQGLSDEGPSASDHLFASTPPPVSLHESGGGGGSESVSGHGNGHRGQHQGNGNGHFGMPVPMAYAPPPPQMMHMPYIGMATHGHGQLGVPPGNGYHGYDARLQFNMMQNKFGSFPQYHSHVAPSDN